MLGVFVLRHGEVLTEGRMLVEYQILLAAVFVIVQLSERETSEVAFFAGNVRIGEVPLSLFVVILHRPALFTIPNNSLWRDLVSKRIK